MLTPAAHDSRCHDSVAASRSSVVAFAGSGRDTCLWRNAMECQRCHGFLIVESPAYHYAGLEAGPLDYGSDRMVRCLNCGNVFDQCVLVNRLRPIPVESVKVAA